MALNDGEKLTLLAKNLKQTRGITTEEMAKMTGISYTHLSRQFSKAWITPAIKSKLIDGLRLPHDFFEKEEEGKPDPPPPATTENEALKAKLELAKEKLAQLEGVYEKYVRLLEEHNQLLRQQKKE